MSPETLTAPVAGAVVPLTEVGDAVFSSGVLGSGVGIAPEAPAVVSPADGVLLTVMPHAYGIRTDGGAEVLVHVGIDTVELDGAHFEPRVTQGDRIARGAALALVDFDAVAAAGYATTVIVVVTNSPSYAGVSATGAGRVEIGDDLLTLAA